MEPALAPRLETERLILRAHKAGDFEAFSAMWRDPVVLEYTIREARSPQDAWMTMHRLLGSWPLLGYGFWAIALKTSNTLIGDAGFMDAMRPETPDKRTTPELGYALATAHHGKGYMTEALEAVHDWLDRAKPGTEAFALIDDANPASIAVAQKFGYRFERRHDFNDRLGALYTRKPLQERRPAD
ncbi:MAG: GNAT family N-acetyltransferase [Pseudomonadota bacterium]